MKFRAALAELDELRDEQGCILNTEVAWTV